MDYVQYALIMAAVFINRKDRPMLALSPVIGFSLVVPVGRFATLDVFCMICIASDLFIGALAVWLNTRASDFILVASALLCIFHVTGWWYGGWLPESPYRVLAPMCEYGEILACSIYPLLPDRRKNELADLTRSGRGYRKS